MTDGCWLRCHCLKVFLQLAWVVNVGAKILRTPTNPLNLNQYLKLGRFYNSINSIIIR